MTISKFMRSDLLSPLKRRVCLAVSALVLGLGGMIAESLHVPQAVIAAAIVILIIPVHACVCAIVGPRRDEGASIPEPPPPKVEPGKTKEATA
jgi:hypothetical protein